LETPEAPKHPFGIRDFRHFFFANLCSTLAQNCLIVVIAWQVYDVARLTMSLKEAALQLGLIGLAQFLPLFILTPITGWISDRIDRRYVSRSCAATQMVCASFLFAMNYFHFVSLAPLFIVAALLGVARAFYIPAQSALSPNLVPRNLLPRAIATSAIAGRVGGIVGPAFGGFLYDIDARAPYLVSALLFATALTSMFGIGRVAIPAMDRSRTPFQQMGDGLAYVFQNRIVLGAISLDLFAVLLGGATAMLPIYARDILHVGPSGLGALRAAPAIGALASALWFSFHPLRQNIGVKMFLAVGVFGAATVGFGLSKFLPFSLVCLAVLGAADMLSVYVRQSLIQMSTPDDKRGRVSAVATLFISASNELGEAESGFLAALIGPVPAVVLGGAGAMLVALLWSYWFPVLRNAKTFELPPQQQKAAT
jgi:MFS family permease